MNYIVAVYSPRTDDVQNGKLYVTLQVLKDVMGELTAYSPMEHMDPDILDDIYIEISQLGVDETWEYSVPADEYYYSDYTFVVLRLE